MAIVMKKLIEAFFFVVFVTIIIPLCVVTIMGRFADKNSADGELIEVYFHDRDEVVSINSEQYLTGVVAAEMNAEFCEEALKAQAVAARTYMYNHLINGGEDEYHKGAKICTDSTHCQAWTDINERMESWGEKAKEYRKKIEDAVHSTKGEVIKYNGEIISALFHSTSSGMTENAADVWGKPIEYLVSVKSDGEEESPNFTSSLEISEEEYKNKISERVENVNFDLGLYSDIVRSAAGGIINMKVGGIEIAGTEFRNIFSLRSTNVNITNDGQNIKMEVKGNGHGVGMSQYGAQYMAKNGAGYEEILKHYYTGVEIATEK